MIPFRDFSAFVQCHRKLIGHSSGTCCRWSILMLIPNGLLKLKTSCREWLAAESGSPSSGRGSRRQSPLSQEVPVPSLLLRVGQPVSSFQSAEVTDNRMQAVVGVH